MLVLKTKNEQWFLSATYKLLTSKVGTTEYRMAKKDVFDLSDKIESKKRSEIVKFVDKIVRGQKQEGR